MDEKSKPVAFAYVSITRSPFNPKDGAASLGITTGADGKFQFSGLMAATYGVCVYTAPTRGFLDTCEWDRQQNIALVSAQAVSGLTLRVEDAGTVEFEVDDPKALKPDETKSGSVRVVLGLHSANGAHTARYLRTAKGKHTYVLNVPFGKQVQLRFEAEGLDVKDDKGAKLVAGQGAANAPFVMNRGQAKKQFLLAFDRP